MVAAQAESEELQAKRKTNGSTALATSLYFVISAVS